MSFMSNRLLISVMMIASLAMLLFVLGFVFWKLGLGFVGGFLYWIAGEGMLLAFGLLLGLGALALLAGLWRELRLYFNAEACALRRVLCLRTRALNARHYWLAQTKQLRFWTGLKRKTALQANNRRHLRSLFLAIDADLLGAKSQLPQVDYRQLRKALRQYHRQADIEAMLALREQLPCR
jgi:hypothetical protein